MWDGKYSAQAMVPKWLRSDRVVKEIACEHLCRRWGSIRPPPKLQTTSP